MNRYRNLLLALGLAGMPAWAGAAVSTQDLQRLIEEARTANDLAHLNTVRIQLREIVFDELPTLADKALYAEAYRVLAWSHRNHRYIRPGYDLLAKFIDLRDAINEQRHRTGLDSLNGRYTAEVNKLKAAVTAQENTERELVAEKALLDDARGTYWLIRVVLVAAVLAAAVLIWVRLRNRMTQARKVYLEHCSELATLQEKVVLGQMTSAVLYHARILNGRIRSEGTKLQQLVPRMETEFAGVRETEPVLKNAHDNLDRINKLVEMNDESLGSFFEGMPVYRHPVPVPA